MAADRMGGMSPALDSRPETPYMDRAHNWGEAMRRGQEAEILLLVVRSHLLERANAGDEAAHHYINEIDRLLNA